ncbi:MAG TPA: PHP-associated domain-containing protein [Candidatus Nanoarchaeia archaeon]|nr:PHP-associated domain-containing protein [Candidatus Nanoarchaeia archaeon]
MVRCYMDVSSGKQGLIRSKPKKLDLSDCTLVDMHFHSKYSYDSRSTIAKILSRAKKLRVGVAITDHNQIQGSLVALSQKDTLVVPGVELKSKEGVHILAYPYSKGDLIELEKKCIIPFMDKSLSLSISVIDLLEKLKGINCLVGAAHPYFSYVGIQTARLEKNFMKSLDCVEVLNASSLKKMNNKAYRWALEEGKGLIGGSDGHRVMDLAKTVTGAEGKVSVEEFLESIRKRQSFVIGRESNLLSKTFEAVSKEAYILTSPKGMKVVHGNLKLAFGHYKYKLKDWVENRKKMKSRV